MFERFDDDEEEEEENDVKKKQRFRRRRCKWYHWFLRGLDVVVSSLIVFLAVLVIRNDVHRVGVSNTRFEYEREC